jgi:hypothetical protein
MKRNGLLAGLMVVLLALGGVGVAHADPARPPFGRGDRHAALIKGEITAIDGAALTVLTEQRGEVIVQTGERTRFRAKDDPDFGLADLRVGDTIAAEGRFVAEKTLAARIVLLVPPEFADHARGKVTAIDGGAIAVEDKDGKTTEILTSGETKFRVEGKPGATIDDVRVGMLLDAAGQFEASGALAAKHVVAREPRAYQGGPIAAGRVSEVNGGQFTIAYPDGSTLTVTADASTLVIKRGEDGPVVGSLSDVTDDAAVVVMGVPAGNGSSLAARVILVGQGRGANGAPQP